MQAYLFRDNYCQNMYEKQENKTTPNLKNAITKELLKENVIEKIDIDVQKMLIWGNLKKKTKEDHLKKYK
jgi:hypothetical protein